jgi:hypothetical protein
MCVSRVVRSVKYFFKGHLLVRQFLHKAGCIQLFLVPIVKSILFCSYHELQIGIMRTAQKTVGAVKIYCTNEKKCCRWFQGTLKVECALSFYGYTFCIGGEDLVEGSFRWLVSWGWYDWRERVKYYEVCLVLNIVYDLFIACSDARLVSVFKITCLARLGFER